MIYSGKDIRDNCPGLTFTPTLAEDQYQQNGVDLILADIEPLDNGGHFVPLRGYLGVTRETVTLPNDIMGFVELRSTWARKGLLIPPTIIDAGFSGELTIEIFSAWCDEAIPLGQRFLHIVFAQMTSYGAPYRGKYYGQKGITKGIL